MCCLIQFSNSVSFVFIVPYMHSIFAPNIHLKWLVQDILYIVVPPSLLILVISYNLNLPITRLGVGLSLTSIGNLLMSTSVFSRFFRLMLIN